MSLAPFLRLVLCAVLTLGLLGCEEGSQGGFWKSDWSATAGDGRTGQDPAADLAEMVGDPEEN